MKTVRFSHIVETCGRPRVHTLWSNPEKDSEFKRARAAHRVMTLVGEAGKADFGVVGYDVEHAASQFLFFPRSLHEFDGAHVIGIKFDLIEQPKLSTADLQTWAAAAPRHAKKKAAAPPSPRPAATATRREDKPILPSRRRPPARAKRAVESHSHVEAKPSDHTLLREVHAALKELESGKTVAAYRRLQRAVT
jgi:hypothetical protein